jgi:hypothetical protein
MSAVRDCSFNTFAATLHIRRPFLHPQPEDAPCCGDSDPLNHGNTSYSIRNLCCTNLYRHRTVIVIVQASLFTARFPIYFGR